VVEMGKITQQLGAEIIRLWCASTDYSGDLGIDDKILARVVDGYRRIRNTLRFLLANTSDFDAATQSVPVAEMLDIDRWALARTAELQAELAGRFDAQKGAFAGGHYGANEFHPVVSKLQVFCSEDLGAFYLDILKDRLYTTAAGSHARRSAQTALWQITHAMLRWMAPFLSFTAEEAWGVMGGQGSLFTQTFWRFDTAVLAEAAPGSERLARWARIRAVRDVVNKEIEALRSTGGLGSSLQAEVAITAGPEDHAALASLGDDLKFVLITSAACLLPGSALQVQVGSLQGRAGIAKCDRCWHWRADVGQDAAHPTLCGRCTSNLFGTGEARCCA
jgi:isoleucyl-tRNA synthetase